MTSLSNKVRTYNFDQIALGSKYFSQRVFNSALKETVKNKGNALAVIHPGFCKRYFSATFNPIYLPSDSIDRYIMAKKQDYCSYFNRIKALIRSTDSTIFIFCENTKIAKTTSWIMNLKPRSLSIIVGTKSQGPKPEVENILVPSYRSILGHTMDNYKLGSEWAYFVKTCKDLEVERFNLAGEKYFYSDGEPSGCASGFNSALKEIFEIQLVKGHTFPVSPNLRNK